MILPNVKPKATRQARGTTAQDAQEPTALGGVAFEAQVRLGTESFREFRRGPLRISYRFARQPGDRLWGHTTPSGTIRVRHALSLHYLAAPDGRKVWGAYLGPLCLYWRWGA